jgi:hypothetical protein
MNTGELNQMLSTLLADSSLNFYTADERLLALNNACKYLNSELRIVNNVATIGITPLEGKVRLPADYITPLNGCDWITERGVAAALDSIPIRQHRASVPDWENEQGEPTALVHEGSNVYLYPSPRSAGNLKLSYLARPNLLTVDDDVPFYGDQRVEPYHDAVAFYAAWMLALKDRDFEASQQFMAYFQSRMIDLKESLRYTSAVGIQPVWSDTYSSA